MLTQESRFIQNARMIVHKEGNGSYFYDPDSGNLKYINQVGTSLYELCDGLHPLVQMITLIAGEYQSVPMDQVEKDVDRFLTELLALDFVRSAS